MSFVPSAAQAPSHAIEHPRSEIVRLHRRGPKINVAPAERGLSLLGGASLIWMGVMRRGWSGAALGVTGAGLAWRGATGHCAVYRSLGIDTAAGPEAALELVHAATILAPLERVRGFLLDPTQFARVARFLDGVEAVDSDRWRVMARLPRGAGRREWELDVVNEQGHVEWRSGSDAPFEHVLRIELSPAPAERGTELVATFAAKPPGGVAGVALGSWLQGVLEHGLGAQLAKLKQQIETGEVATLGDPPAGARSRLRARIEERLPQAEGSS